jgi:hypothetical protein
MFCGRNLTEQSEKAKSNFQKRERKKKEKKNSRTIPMKVRVKHQKEEFKIFLKKQKKQNYSET